LWASFSSSDSQLEYCQGWLDLQCARIAHVRQGILVLRDDDQYLVFSPVAHWPVGEVADASLIDLADRVIVEDCGLVSQLATTTPENGPASQYYGVAYPLKVEQEITGVVAIAVGIEAETELADAMENLQWGVSWIELMIRRHQQRSLNRDLPRLQQAVETLTAVLSETHFQAACMAFVTLLASTLHCERVSLGFLRWGRLKVVAVSNSAQFGKRMNLVSSLESAMEEAVFQRAAITLPDSGNSQLVALDHSQLASDHGCTAIHTLPLFSGDGYYGALTLERSGEHPFSDEDLDTLRAIAALGGEALRDKQELDRPLVIKAAESIRVQSQRLLGAGFLGRKLAGLILIAAALFFSFVTDTYQVAADSQLEGAIRQVVVAPFDGYIDSAPVRAGDVVRKNQLMSKLDERDLRLERLKWVSDRAKLQHQYERAQALHDRAEAKVLEAQLEQNQAQLNLVESRQQRTAQRAPFDGLVVSGDLSQQLGSAVKQGDVLFEVAPLNAYRIILWVDEHQIADIRQGQSGQLMLTAMPGQTFEFVVTKITPLTKARDGGNFFRVESSLSDPAGQLRPGMEGVGKINVDERNVFIIWTQPLVRWLTLRVWSWTWSG
jgi:RND family efflux transporter MFP subunit